MEIFGNWIFWVVIAAIIFIFALIGFLTDKKKKNKDESNASASAVKVKAEEANSSKDSVSNLNVDTGLDASNNEVVVPNSEVSIPADIDTQNAVKLDDSTIVSSEDATSVDRNQVSMNTLDIKQEKIEEPDVSIQPSDSVNNEDVEINIVPSDVNSSETSDGANTSNDTNVSDVWN